MNSRSFKLLKIRKHLNSVIQVCPKSAIPSICQIDYPNKVLIKFDINWLCLNIIYNNKQTLAKEKKKLFVVFYQRRNIHHTETFM